LKHKTYKNEVHNNNSAATCRKIKLAFALGAYQYCDKFMLKKLKLKQIGKLPK
jgi:hypothetical protein